VAASLLHGQGAPSSSKHTSGLWAAAQASGVGPSSTVWWGDGGHQRYGPSAPPRARLPRRSGRSSTLNGGEAPKRMTRP